MDDWGYLGGGDNAPEFLILEEALEGFFVLKLLLLLLLDHLSEICDAGDFKVLTIGLSVSSGVGWRSSLRSRRQLLHGR